MTMDVLHNHDGIVHQNPDGENQRKQGNPIEGKAPGPGSKQGDRQGDNHCQTDDQRLPPAQRKQHQ